MFDFCGWPLSVGEAFVSCRVHTGVPLWALVLQPDVPEGGHGSWSLLDKKVVR